MPSNELLEALSVLAGRSVSRTELAEILGISDRTITRYGQNPEGTLNLAELRTISNHLGLSLLTVLLQFGVITHTEVMAAADEHSPRLSEATPLELAKRLTELLT